MFLLLTLNIFHTFFNVSIVDLEQVNVTCYLIWSNSYSFDNSEDINYFCNIGSMKVANSSQLHNARAIFWYFTLELWILTSNGYKREVIFLGRKAIFMLLYFPTRISGCTVALSRNRITFLFLLIIWQSKSQRQIWDTLQGVSCLGVQFIRAILALYDRYFLSSFFSIKILLLSLNELGEKSQATIILCKFVNTPESNSHWLIVFGKCFSLVKI